jgi:hypothetical protein
LFFFYLQALIKEYNHQSPIINNNVPNTGLLICADDKNIINKNNPLVGKNIRGVANGGIIVINYIIYITFFNISIIKKIEK